MFKDKKILITGGTGSLGTALTKLLLNTDVNTIRIFSRNEHQQILMQEEIKDERMRFLIGDVRDRRRLIRAMEDIDIVFHAAALKHVPVVEYNPFEGVQTNVIGSQNVIDASLEAQIDMAVALSTDKAVVPLNTYGATKLLMEKMFVTAKGYLNPHRHKTKFLVLRYGNVMGSRGSVIPKFVAQIKNKEKITITDLNMTRFTFTMKEALKFIIDSTMTAKGSEIFVPKLKAYTISDLKNAVIELLEDTGEEKIPIRPGEKMHEVLIDSDEMRSAWESEKNYVIFNPQLDPNEIENIYPHLKKVSNKESYSSKTTEKISKNKLKEIITNAGLLD